VDEAYRPNDPPAELSGTATKPGETDWRWCSRCQGLFYNGGSDIGRCAATKGPHSTTGSTKVYRLARIGDSMVGEKGWKWCSVCQGLFYGGDATAGVCLGGGGHDRSDSTEYVLAYGSAAGNIESDWRWCKSCELLYFGGAGSGVCAANTNGHGPIGAKNYCLRCE
jgi:hypothetical protein